MRASAARPRATSSVVSMNFIKQKSVSVAKWAYLVLSISVSCPRFQACLRSFRELWKLALEGRTARTPALHIAWNFCDLVLGTAMDRKMLRADFTRGASKGSSSQKYKLGADVYVTVRNVSWPKQDAGRVSQLILRKAKSGRAGCHEAWSSSRKTRRADVPVAPLLRTLGTTYKVR